MTKAGREGDLQRDDVEDGGEPAAAAKDGE